MPESKPPRRAGRGAATPWYRPAWLGHYLDHTRGPAAAAALTLPLMLFYGLGVTLVPREVRNGVDLISGLLDLAVHRLTTEPKLAYLAIYGTLALANAVLIAVLARSDRLQPRYWPWLLAECSVWAVATGTLSSAATRELTGALAGTAAAGAAHLGPIDGLIVSAGAGLHEELVFRLVGIAGVARLCLGSGWRTDRRLIGLVVVNALLFSAAHEVGSLGVKFDLTVFAFRVFAGLFFAALFLLRGFAVAAWTHALYDAWVIVLLGR